MTARRARRESDSFDATLRNRVVRGARRRASIPDAEDRAQEVMLRLLQEVARPDAPVLQVRALAKLKDVEVEAFRKKSRDKALLQKAANTEATNNGSAISQDAFRIIEMSEQIRECVGDDGTAYALVKTFFRATETDVAKYLGWSPQRAAAARMRLARNKSRITKFLSPTSEEG